MHSLLHHLYTRPALVALLLAGLFPGQALHGQTLGMQVEGHTSPPVNAGAQLGVGGGLFYSFRLHHHLAVRTGVLAGAHGTGPGTGLKQPVWSLGGYVLPTHVMRNGFAFKAGITMRSVLLQEAAPTESPDEPTSPGLRMATRIEAGHQGRVAELSLFVEVPLLGTSELPGGWQLGLSAAVPLVQGDRTKHLRRRSWRRTLQPWADPKARSGRIRYTY